VFTFGQGTAPATGPDREPAESAHHSWDSTGGQAPLRGLFKKTALEPELTAGGGWAGKRKRFWGILRKIVTGKKRAEQNEEDRKTSATRTRAMHGSYNPTERSQEEAAAKSIIFEKKGDHIK